MAKFTHENKARRTNNANYSNNNAVNAVFDEPSNVPHFIPHFKESLHVTSSGLPKSTSHGTFKEKEIQLVPSELPQYHGFEQTYPSTLPKTILAEVHTEPFKILNSVTSNSESYLSSCSDNNKMTVYSILRRNSKSNGLSVNGSLPNGFAKILRSPEVHQDVKLNIEKSDATGDHENTALETVLREQEPMTSGQALNDANNNDPVNHEIHENKETISEQMTDLQDKKSESHERRASGSIDPVLPMPDTTESSAPSPNWTTKILNSELKIQATNQIRTTGGYNYRQPLTTRQLSSASRYSYYDHPPERLTDLRKILNPEVEKKDFETVFKAHWETFMDCRCFECTFNNAAKFITVAVLAITFFLFVKALANIFQR